MTRGTRGGTEERSGESASLGIICSLIPDQSQGRGLRCWAGCWLCPSRRRACLRATSARSHRRSRPCCCCCAQRPDACAEGAGAQRGRGVVAARAPCCRGRARLARGRHGGGRGGQHLQHQLRARGAGCPLRAACAACAVGPRAHGGLAFELLLLARSGCIAPCCARSCSRSTSPPAPRWSRSCWARCRRRSASAAWPGGRGRSSSRLGARTPASPRCLPCFACLLPLPQQPQPTSRSASGCLCACVAPLQPVCS